jgi:quinoprotein glucose dehydrogenase
MLETVKGALLLAALLAALASCRERPAAGRLAEGGGPDTEWRSYGNDPGGQRFADLADVTPENVSRLAVAWTYPSGDASDGTGAVPSTSAFEATPILVDGTLYFCTPFSRVIALDPSSGVERWSFDPGIDLSGSYANQLVCRGVASWLDRAAPDGSACRRRILTATNDARLLALDAATGRPCADFGAAGEIDLNPAAGPQRWRGEFQVTSPPAVVGDLVVVGSAISDNQRSDAPSGVVRAFGARKGRLRWAWDLAPPGYVRTPENTSGAGHVLGTPNAWAPFSVDEARDLVFVPTGNPMLDYFRGGRPGIDHYGSSVVALRGTTGEVVWRFQTVHHDLWDYDVPAQPTLTTVRREGAALPAVVQATKMGLLFVLHRETGEPLFPVEERPVPQQGAPGERLSPTQPFPVRPPPLVRHTLSVDDAWGLLFFDRRWCRERIRALRNDGIYTPPTLQGSIMFPGNIGGSNWGGVAVDPERQVVVANVSEVPFLVTLLPRERYAAEKEANPDVEIAPQEGAPFALRREPFLSPLGVPCVRPPWGRLAAVDLGSGEILWSVPFGTGRDLRPIPLPIRWGTPNVGGPLVTRSGLVFIGAAMDDYLRAFDLATGDELWKARLPAGGQATPMTYRAGGHQFVVIAAGGHGRAGTSLGGALVAFALAD